MKRRAVNWLLLLGLVAVLVGVSGCSTESENASVRPWNSPQGWESNGSLGGMDTQHR